MMRITFQGLITAIPGHHSMTTILSFTVTVWSGITGLLLEQGGTLGMLALGLLGLFLLRELISMNFINKVI